MRGHRKATAGVLLFLIAGGGVFFIARSARPEPLNPEHLARSMARMGEWFAANQTPAGDFVYGRHAANGEPLRGYNIVRQAGSLYALAQLYRHSGNSGTEAVLEKGFSFFEGLTVADAEGARAIEHKGSIRANTGALYLLALIEYMEARPDARGRHLTQSVGLAEYLLRIQKENGAYPYRTETGEESAYNDGEAMYAMIRMARVAEGIAPVAARRYLASAERAASYYEKKYAPIPGETASAAGGGASGEFNFSYYAWAMAAHAHLFQETGDARYWTTMKTLTDEFFETGYAYDAREYIVNGAGEPPAGNLAVYMEGLAHAAWIAKTEDPAYFARLRAFMEPALAYLQGLQINGPSSKRTSARAEVRYGACYDYACATERIDIVHHNLSAIYLYLTYAAER